MMTSSHGTRWLTTTEAAKIVKVSTRVIYHAVKRGKLRAAKIDGRGDLRFRRQWIDEWVESCTTPLEIGVPR